MTSQSPTEGGVLSLDYADAWNAIRVMVMDQGLSWSGSEKNRLFLNLGNKTFAEFSALSAADSVADGRALVELDWDDDGRLDLLLKNRTAPRLQFFRNQMPGTGHFLAISLVGKHCNRDAIGALVEVQAGGRSLRRRLYAGEGYMAQSSKRLHFGLGSATSLQGVTVHWPDGSSDSYSGIEADLRYRLTQGDPVAKLVARRPAPALEGALSSVPAPLATRGRRIPLIEKLALAELVVPAWENATRKVSDLSGQPLLLNLWGRTCAACLGEFAEFKERRDELDRARLRIVTLCTDPPEEREAALEVLRRFGLERDAGYADEQLVQAFQPIMEEVLGVFDVVPLPASLLLDRKGQMVCLYLGPIEIDQLLTDLESTRQMNPRKSSSTRLMGGMRLFKNRRDYAALARGFGALGQFHMARFFRALTLE